MPLERRRRREIRKKKPGPKARLVLTLILKLTAES
jgi:hypothetical protein